MKLPLRLISLSLLLNGCATSPSSEAQKIQESDEGRMASCKILGTVSGNSSWGGWTAAGLKESAMTEALNQAGKLGATHIVWQNVVQSNSGGIATGRAYRCN